MKSILTTLLLLLVCLNLTAQSAEWTKADRNVLFDEYNSFLVQYKNLSQEQRESLSLCCLDETTKGYSKAQYNAKIDIELKRIKEATIIQCAKNMGIDLKKTEAVEDKPNAPRETTEWTREDKSKLAKEKIDFLDDYEHLTESEKENLTLCYIEDVTSNKTKKEYESLIDIELRQLKKTTVLKCAKKLGISLEATVKQEVKVEKTLREQLIGTWRTDQNYTIQFKDDGTFIKTFHSRFKIDPKFFEGYTYSDYITNNTTSGTWFLDNNQITLDENIKVEWTSYTRRYGNVTKYESYLAKTVWTLNEITDKFLKLQYVSGVHCCKEVYSTPPFIMGNKQ
jgi:hypothetical protein